MFLWKVLLIFLIIAIHFGYGHPNGGKHGVKPTPDGEASRNGRFFDTYVTHHRPNRYPNPSSYYAEYGYGTYDPDYFGLPMDYLDEGQSIYCPPGFVYDGFTNPLDAGHCFIDSFYY